MFAGTVTVDLSGEGNEDEVSDVVFGGKRARESNDASHDDNVEGNMGKKAKTESCKFVFKNVKVH